MVSRLTGYAGAAEQGDRRAQRVRARVGHPPGRRAQGARDLRDHGRARRSGWTPTSSCSASTPAATRCARRWRSWASSVDGAGAERRLQALQGARRQEEAGHRDGPRGARHRRAARASCRAYTLEWFDVEASSRRGRRTRRSRSARPTASEATGDVHRRRPDRRGLPRDQRRHRDRGRAARVPRRRGDRRQGRARRGRASCSSSTGEPRRGPGRRDRHHRGGGASPTCARCRNASAQVPQRGRRSSRRSSCTGRAVRRRAVVCGSDARRRYGCT